MLTSFTRDEKKILLFLIGLIAASSAIVMVAGKNSEVPVLRGTPLAQASVLSVSAPTETTGALERVLGPTGQIDLNAATVEALRSIPGVGPSLAEAIISYRGQIGSFSSLEQLDSVPGIGPATFAKLRPHLFVSAPAAATPSPEVMGAAAVTQSTPASTMVPAAAVAQGPALPVSSLAAAQPVRRVAPVSAPSDGPVNLNTATAEQLAELHRVGPVLAQRIIQYRNAYGPFRTIADLDNVKGVGPKILQDNAHRLTLR